MIEVRYQNGVYLPALELWLDPHRAQSLAFVSHAHSDHLGQHREVILSHGTAALMRERMSGQRIEHILPFGERRDFERFAITLLPAGHILGSSQSYIESEHGSLLYTGDFKLRPGLSTDPAEWREAETLIMETTFGLPKFRFPPTAEVIAAMVAFCRDALADGAVPVLLGYSLGKSQEILCALTDAGLMPMLHGAVWKMTEVYRQLRPDFPTNYRRYASSEVQGHVLICPPSAQKSPMITRLKNRRIAVLTGWAIEPAATYRYQCDAAFPLSDHADYQDLLRAVEIVKPRRVLTLHGFAAAFARDLRERGYDAWAISEVNQLELPITATSQRPPKKTPQTPINTGPFSGFARFCEVCESIAATGSKLLKVERLAAWLKTLDATELPLAATWLTGRAFGQGDPRVLQVGWAVIRRALGVASGLGEARIREISRAHSDAGRTTQEAMLGRVSAGDWPLAEVAAYFDALHHARGPASKCDLLIAQLLRLSAEEAGYLVRILTGDLRIGLKEGLVEESLAAAFGATTEAVREARMLTGDLSETANLTASGRLDEARPALFRPIQVMLASPEPTAQAVWNRIADHDAWVEDKYDGIRAQLHSIPGRAELYSRDLRCITAQFPELAVAAARLESEVILDGEIIAMQDGRTLTFFDLQRRLGRRVEADLFLQTQDVPVVFKVFDLLWLDGTPCLHRPLRERRALLEKCSFPERIEIIATTPVDSPTAIAACFDAARARGNEGLIIKSAKSIYTPGRRGHAWVKLKKELATLDVVVIGVENGHGKRAHVLSDYTFAVRDDSTDALLPIGKAYSGLTDAEIEELTEHFLHTTIKVQGRYREVRPEIVLEVAFDSVQPSDRHASGLSLRFPRIKAIRRDKTPADIDTLRTARQLCR